MFMHNGSLGDWDLIRRKVEALIPDAYYRSRIGTTDSEAAFLAILGDGAEHDAVGALTRTVARIAEMIRSSGAPNAFRFTSALSDGESLYAVRYALPREAANTLYFREDGGNLVIASEPLDAERSGWNQVPANHILIAPAQGEARLEPFLEAGGSKRERRIA
jgi:predicted glutamine amidotransferase